MERQLEIIENIEKSYTNIPRNSVTQQEFQYFFHEIDAILTALEKETCGEYEAAMLSYLRSHIVRYSLTLSHIPHAKEGEQVLDVGGYGIFPYLLYHFKGYKNIVCLDYYPEGPAQGERQLSVLGTTISIPFLNVNLDDSSSYPPPRCDSAFSRIFFFEVLEHLLNPMEVVLFLKSYLAQNGELYISTPNCCSLLSFHKLLNLFVPMTYNCFNPRRWDTHFREWTPFALKYLLACAGMSEECFDVFYCFAEQSSFPKEAFELYPFPGNIQLNAFLLGDDLFSIATANTELPIMQPPLFYDFGEFLTTYYNLHPERKKMAWFFNYYNWETLPGFAGRDMTLKNRKM